MIERALFIPVVGTKLKLLNKAVVTLKNTAQNTRFIEALQDQAGNVAIMQGKDFHLTLNPGVRMEVDRVYIRKGDGSEFNSLTFKVDAQPAYGLPKGRFFIPVSEVNSLVVEVLEDNKPASISLRKTWQSEFRELPIETRLNHNITWLALPRVESETTVLEGHIHANVVTSLTYIENKVKSHADALGFTSTEGVFSDYSLACGEKDLSALRQSMSCCKQRLLGQTSAPVLHYRLVMIGGEWVVHAKKVSGGVMGSLEELIYNYSHLFLHTQKEGVRLRFPDALNMDRFGFTGTTNKFPFISSDKQQALLLEDGFSDYIILRTRTHKFERLDHEFHFDVNGDMLIAAAFRRHLTKLKKPSS